jgi:hypothetical protein
MSDEEKIVELPERPPDLPNRTSMPIQKATPEPGRQKRGTSIPSKAPIRDEDIFQRFHIIREITTIKGRYQSESHEMAAKPVEKGNVFQSAFHEMATKLVEKGDVIGLKALLERFHHYVPEPCLVTAARQNFHLDAFRLLISAGDDVRKADFIRRTPLHYSQDEQVARLLISHGADVHAVDIHNQTPLHTARDEHIARLLISHGANVHAVYRNGQTPLHTARDEHIAQLLISHGANVHAVYRNGQTPLHTAANEQIAQLLISHGAGVHAVDNGGETLAITRRRQAPAGGRRLGNYVFTSQGD